MKEQLTSHVIAKPRQWDAAFDTDMNAEDVQRLLSIPPSSQ